MEELVAAIHIHTKYSDGTNTHKEIAQIAAQCGIDILLFSDHNVMAGGKDGYFQENGQTVLSLVGEEIHNRNSVLQNNHLLVFGSDRELSQYGEQRQVLLDQVQTAGGISFLAHIIDPPLLMFGESDLSWDDWDLTGYSGIEIWNNFSELKARIHNFPQALFYALFPQFIAQSPFQKALDKWDELLAGGHHLTAIGGADAHALQKRFGPFTRSVFPYQYHFRAITTHLLVPHKLSSNLENDRAMVMDCLKTGRCFVSYDLPAPTTGFRFSAQTRDESAVMGETIHLVDGVTFQIRPPDGVECCLIHNGKPIKAWKERDLYTYITRQPGVYRVECYRPFLGKRRGWIYSNPIYVIQ